MSAFIGKKVLVRCKNAGVHTGVFVDRTPDTLTLKDSCRIWRWRGAHDLSEVSMMGVSRSAHTRISCVIPIIQLTASDVCEVMLVAEGVDLSPVHNE